MEKNDGVIRRFDCLFWKFNRVGFKSNQLNSKMFICNMHEHTYNNTGSLKPPMTGLFDPTVYRILITNATL